MYIYNTTILEKRHFEPSLILTSRLWSLEQAALGLGSLYFIALSSIQMVLALGRDAFSEVFTPTGAVRIAMEYFAGRAATGFAVPEWLPTPDNIQYNEAVSHLDGIVYRIIAQRRAWQRQDGSPARREQKAGTFSAGFYI